MFRRTCKLLIPLLAALLLPVAASAAPATTPDRTTAALQQAVNGHWRSDANRARDKYRHPLETLQFFGIKPDMTVIELAPGGGWYTEILAPFLHAHGHLIEAAPPSAAKFAAKLKADPAVYGHIAKVIPFAPPEQVKLGADHSADMVLTFRNTHDWLNHSPATLERCSRRRSTCSSTAACSASPNTAPNRSPMAWKAPGHCTVSPRIT